MAQVRPKDLVVAIVLCGVLGVGCASKVAAGPPALPPAAPSSDRPAFTAAQVACLKKAARAANPNAMPEALAVLAYLRELPHRNDHRIISGQFIGSGKYSSLKEIQQTYDKTGKWVGMIGNDYAVAHQANTQGNPYLIDYWNKGGLVTVSFHALNPQNHRFGSVNNRKINFQDLLHPETAAYKTWTSDLDVVAAGLKQLQDNGVVVLWRPFHEMNKDFFWWGNRPVEDFVKLWRQTFDYLTRTKGLNNLLWVYSPYQAPDTDKYYPGDDYVDIVAMDAYETYPEKIQGYDALAKIDKPFGFAEFGPSGKLLIVIPIVDKNVDYNRIFQTIKTKFPKTSFLHAWNDGWGFQSHQNIREMMSDPAMITREDLAWRSVCAR